MNMEMYQYLELIDKYNSGDMSLDEKKGFLEMIETDPTLRLEFNIRYKMIEKITAQIDLEEVLGDPELENILKELDQKNRFNHTKEKEGLFELISNSIGKSDTTSYRNAIKTTKKDKKKRMKVENRKIYYISSILLAASIALLFVVTNPSRDLSVTKIFIRYYEKFEPINYTYRNSTEYEEDFMLALGAFKEGKIESAISIFQSLSSSKIFAEEIAFYLPLAYMEEDNFQAAVAGLEEYLAIYSNYSIEASWYLSLSYLKMKELDKARIILSEIESTPTIYQKSAKELLALLDRINK